MEDKISKIVKFTVVHILTLYMDGLILSPNTTYNKNVILNAEWKQFMNPTMIVPIHDYKNITLLWLKRECILPVMYWACS